MLALAKRHQEEYEHLAAMLDEMERRGPNQGPELGFRVPKARALKEETKQARKRWPRRPGYGACAALPRRGNLIRRVQHTVAVPGRLSRSRVIFPRRRTISLGSGAAVGSHRLTGRLDDPALIAPSTRKT